MKIGPDELRQSITAKHGEKVAGRFMEKLSIKTSGRCWDWLGATGSYGHGRFKVNGALVSPHRLVYEATYGPIQTTDCYHGAVVKHRYDNPQCCNPKHMRIGTQKENAADMGRKSRGSNSRQRDCRPVSWRPSTSRPRDRAGRFLADRTVNKLSRPDARLTYDVLVDAETKRGESAS